MFLATSPTAITVLAILAFLLLGFWPVFQKLTGRWRQELFFYDFALGSLLTAGVLALVLGFFNSAELSFTDSLMLTARRNLAYALISGGLFGIGMLLVMTAAGASSLAATFSTGFGLALIVALVQGWIAGDKSNGSIGLAAIGAVLALIGAVAGSVAGAAQARKAPGPPLPPLAPGQKRPKRKNRAPVFTVVFSWLGGLFLALYLGVLVTSRQTEIGVAPYPALLLFVGGMFGAILLFNPFVMNFPIWGAPMSVRDFLLNGSFSDHSKGLLAGALFAGGMLCLLLLLPPAGNAAVPPVLSAMMTIGFSAVTVLSAAFLFGELRNAAPDAKTPLLAAAAAHVLAVAVVIAARLFPG
jgi:glucose uptake protein